MSTHAQQRFFFHVQISIRVSERVCHDRVPPESVCRPAPPRPKSVGPRLSGMMMMMMIVCFGTIHNGRPYTEGESGVKNCWILQFGCMKCGPGWVSESFNPCLASFKHCAFAPSCSKEVGSCCNNGQIDLISASQLAAFSRAPWPPGTPNRDGEREKFHSHNCCLHELYSFHVLPSVQFLHLKSLFLSWQFR